MGGHGILRIRRYVKLAIDVIIKRCRGVMITSMISKLRSDHCRERRAHATNATHARIKNMLSKNKKRGQFNLQQEEDPHEELQG